MLFSKRTPLFNVFILHVLVRPIMKVSEWIPASSLRESNECSVILHLCPYKLLSMLQDYNFDICYFGMLHMVMDDQV